MDTQTAGGAPLMAAIIVLGAILLLGGISLAFQGHVDF